MPDPTPMDGEPTFDLMARDPFAPALVRLWATQRRLDVRNGQRPVSDLDQIERAERTAERMEEWRRDADEAWKTQPELPLPSEGFTKIFHNPSKMIDWEGGPCPVDADVLVVVEFNDGQHETETAGELDWLPGGGIRRYEVLF